MQHPPVIPPLYTARIIGRLSAAIEERIRERATGVRPQPDWEELREIASDPALNAPDLLRFLDLHPELRTERVVRSVPVVRMLALEDAARLRAPELQSLTAYYVVDARGTRSSLRALLQEVLAVDQVRTAYRELNLTDPAGSGDYTGTQGYLDAAPVGVGARPAIAAGYTGAGIGCIDIERMWNLQHEDLQGGVAPGTLVYNDNYNGLLQCRYH